MAITLESNYCKKIGLPGYSSHQYSLTVRTEIADLTQAPAESQRLYGLLQQAVDTAIQQTGFLPQSAAPTNGHTNGNGQRNGNGNGHGRYSHPRNQNGAKGDYWNCTPKQKELILKLVDEQHLPKDHVESLSQERFGKRVKQLNKLEASGLIEELMETQPAAQ